MGDRRDSRWEGSLRASDGTDPPGSAPELVVARQPIATKSPRTAAIVVTALPPAAGAERDGCSHAAALPRLAQMGTRLDRVNVPRDDEICGRDKLPDQDLSPFYSPIELAMLVAVKPRAYLREAIRRAVRNPGTATLPRDFKSLESRG